MRCKWKLAQTRFGIVSKIFSTRCNWNLAGTKFGISLEYFRGDATELWIKQDLELSWIVFDEIQLEFG